MLIVTFGGLKVISKVTQNYNQKFIVKIFSA